MKRYSLILTTAAVILGMLSCNKVEEPYLKDITVDGARVVLLEDYTGIRCTNCPAAAETAHELLERYPNNLVVLSVHAGAQSQPMPGMPDFTTEAGTTWYNTFDFSANPIGTVNRFRKSSGYGYNDGEWGTKIQEEINEGQSADITINPAYNESTRKLDICINSLFTKEIEGDFYLFACIMEDSIQGYQSTPTGHNPDYWHCHVFRTPINGTWGQPLFNGLTEIDQEFETNLSITLDTTYRDNQCYVVSYIYDSSDKYIIQACQKKIK